MNAIPPQSAEALKTNVEQQPETAPQKRAELAVDLAEQKADTEVAKEQRELQGKLAKEAIEKGDKSKGFDKFSFGVNLAMMTAGAYGIYKFWDWMNGDEASKDAKNTQGTSFPWKLAAGIAVATGAYLGKDKLFDWVSKNWGITFEGSKEKVEEYVQGLKDKGLAAANDLGFDVQDDFIKTAAKEMGIEPKNLFQIQDVNYGELSKQHRQYPGQSYAEWALTSLDIPSLRVVKFDDQAISLQTEAIVIAYIEKNHGALTQSDMEKMSVRQILEKIVKEPQGEGSEAKIMETTEEAKGSFPSATEVIENYSEYESMTQFASDLIDTSLTDGASLIINDGGVFLVKEGVALFVSSSLLLGSALLGLVEAPFSDEVSLGNVVTSYAYQDSTLIGSGAVLGATLSMLKGKSPLWGALKGAKDGALAPWTVLKTSAKWTGQIKASLEAFDRVNESFWLTSKAALASMNPAEKERWLKASLEYHATEFERFYEVSQSISGSSFSPKNWGTKFMEWASPKRAEKAMKAHILGMKKAYEDLNPGQKFPFDITHTGDKLLEIQKFAAEQILAVQPPVATRAHMDEATEALQRESVEKMSTQEKIDSIKAASKEADEYLDSAITTIKQMKAEGKTPAEIEAFTKEVESKLSFIRERCKSTLLELKSASKTMTPDEIKALKGILTQELAHASGVRGLAREVQGRGKMALVLGTANLVIEGYALSKEDKEAYVTSELAELSKELGLDTLQLVLDIMAPFGMTDWYTAWHGTEMLTGKEVGNWERASRIVFGTYSAVTDSLAALGGLATAEFAGAGGGAIYGASNLLETGLRAAGKSGDVIASVHKALPRIQVLARDLGGYKELALTLQKRSGQLMTGIIAYDVSKAIVSGVEIMFDTNGEEEIEFDFSEEEPASPNNGGEEPASTLT